MTPHPTMPRLTPSPTPDPAAHIRDLAYRVIGTDRGRDYWMTHPSAELGGKSPKELIEEGNGEVVRQYLEAALVGDFG